ncbi:hypothetical protein PILCRDRAFT_87904 [Piloderma croceum F 1598]|uniref:Secreted protein n=1 Tax=Piloderma croceum (strain F 1598) TaxID=765440 RepID=A0A0C3G081_PILCF|nr:hypothetical protein PILCRDRAFT_87904 [Piloderma croceum F 1598]
MVLLLLLLLLLHVLQALVLASAELLSPSLLVAMTWEVQMTRLRVSATVDVTEDVKIGRGAETGGGGGCGWRLADACEDERGLEHDVEGGFLGTDLGRALVDPDPEVEVEEAEEMKLMFVELEDLRWTRG